MKNLIKTGTRSISIADRAVAATMPEKVTIVTSTKENPLPEGLTSAFVGKDAAAVKEFITKLALIKAKWAALYKTLNGKTTEEKRKEYRVMVVGWAQENGAPDFLLLTAEKPAKAKAAKPAKAKAEKPAKAKAPVKAPLDLQNEFSDETEPELNNTPEAEVSEFED